MAKEIKDFQVWHPPPPPKDEPFFVDPPNSDYWPWYFRKRRQQITSTGAIWLFVPWSLFFWKRFSFSILELFAWIAAWGANSGAVLRLLVKYECSPGMYLFLLYGVFHIHCLAFTW